MSIDTLPNFHCNAEYSGCHTKAGFAIKCVVSRTALESFAPSGKVGPRDEIIVRFPVTKLCCWWKFM